MITEKIRFGFSSSVNAPLRPIHSERKRNFLMFVIFSLIFSAFASAFTLCEWAFSVNQPYKNDAHFREKK